MNQRAALLSNVFTGRPSAVSGRVVVLSAVLLVGLAGVLLQTINQPALAWLCAEDGLVESATAIFYLLAALLFVYANREYRYGNVWYWGYALLFFAIAGEEISWGQRLFGFHTPEGLAAMNVQQEANFHNIEGIHGSIRMAGLLVVLAVCYAVPISDRVLAYMRRFYARLAHPVFPLWAASIVTVAILFMVIPRLALGSVIFEMDELGEVFLAVAFLIFGTSVASADQKSRLAEAC